MKSYVNRVPAPPPPMVVKDIGLKLEPVEFQIVRLGVSNLPKAAVQQALGSEAANKLYDFYNQLADIKAE